MEIGLLKLVSTVLNVLKGDLNNMEYYLLDVKMTINVNGTDVAFDYINTYFNPHEAVKEAKVLSLDDNVKSVSVHKWFITEKGKHDHADGNDSILFHYEKGLGYMKKTVYY